MQARLNQHCARTDYLKQKLIFLVDAERLQITIGDFHYCALESRQHSTKRQNMKSYSKNTRIQITLRAMKPKIFCFSTVEINIRT